MKEVGGKLNLGFSWEGGTSEKEEEENECEDKTARRITTINAGWGRGGRARAG